MSILNYIFIGVVFIFMVDMIAVWTRKNPEVQKAMLDFGWKERLISIFIWPIAALVFFNAFYKSRFKK